MKFDLGEGKHIRRIKLANEYYYADSDGKVTFNVSNKGWKAYLKEIPTITGLNFASGEYQISSTDDLKALAAYVNTGNTCEGLKFKLTADIPMTGVNDFAGIGDSTHAFKGTFDGGNFTISNLNIGGIDYVGLIANGESATVKNLTLLNPTLTGTGNANIGAIIGFGKNSTIENCNVVDANISADSEGISSMKGVAAGVDGTIKNCFYSGNVELCGSSSSKENNKKIVERIFSDKYSAPSVTCADDAKKTFNNKTYYVEGAAVTLNLAIADNYQN